NGAPNPTSYAWDFGNGSTSTLQNPPPQTFSPDGSYQVTLQTTIGGYVLQSVTLTSVNGAWCGDIEEPNLPLVGCTGLPDLYFLLTNASGGTYTSSVIGESTSGSWDGLSLLMDNPPYSISFYDEDAISGNDLLGTYNIPISGAGAYFFNVAGGTAGSLLIANEPQQVFNDTAVVTVFPLPEVTVSQNAATSEICATDAGLSAYTWLLDGQPVAGENEPCVLPSGPGVWQLVAANAFGCADTSNAIVVCPVFSIAQSAGVLFVPSGYTSYAWTFNGAPIGGNSPFVLLQGDGTYGVVVDAGNGCMISLSYVWSTVGMDEAGPGGARMAVFPVPSDGLLNVVAEGLSGATVRLLVTDASGRAVMDRGVAPARGRLREALELELEPGAYTVRIVDGERSLTARAIVR
ncbi:MAG: PKD domain-containing protein, partial [Flavobacteriales bacterium]